MNEQDENTPEAEYRKNPLHFLQQWKETYSPILLPLVERTYSELEALEQRWKRELENYDQKHKELEQQLLTLNAESERLSNALYSKSLFDTIFKRKTIRQMQDQFENTRSAIENCSRAIRMNQEAHDSQLSDINTAIENFSNDTLKALDAYVDNIREQQEACKKDKTAAIDRQHQSVIGNAAWLEPPVKELIHGDLQ